MPRVGVALVSPHLFPPTLDWCFFLPAGINAIPYNTVDYTSDTHVRYSEAVSRVRRGWGGGGIYWHYTCQRHAPDNVLMWRLQLLLLYYLCIIISLNISSCSHIKHVNYCCIFDPTYIIYIYIHIYKWYLKIFMLHLIIVHHLFTLCSALYVCIYKYFILLLCIITFIIDYYYVLLHTPSHVWPEFTKLLSIIYWESYGERAHRHTYGFIILIKTSNTTVWKWNASDHRK